MLKSLFIPALLLFIWPLGLFLGNSINDFVIFFLATPFLVISFFLFNKKNPFWIFPLILIALIGNKLILLPLLAAILNIVLINRTRLSFFFLILSLVIILLNFRIFFADSIFIYNHDSRQEIIQKGYLYPNVWLSRMFQNKPSIYWERFTFNFFALIDPNNYFFHFHPREIVVDNQNLDKFPFLSIVFFILGLLSLPNSRYRKFLLILIPILIFNLSLLKNFDRYDFSLYFPMFLIIISGFNHFKSYLKVPQKIFLAIFLIFTLTEYLHLIIRNFPKLL